MSSIVLYREGRAGGQQFKAILHVDQLLLDGTVVAAKIVERPVQLLHQCDKQHCIAHCQLAICYALRVRLRTSISHLCISKIHPQTGMPSSTSAYACVHDKTEDD